jgi:serine/threonine protein kinase
MGTMVDSKEQATGQWATGPYSGGMFVPPSPAELATRLPNLEILELIGHGGMGVVYKGRQPFLDRLVAIKLVRPDFGGSGDSEERFIREARSLARLQHPNIVTVFDFGKASDLCYLVMEYVEGSSLRRRLTEKSVSTRDVLDFVPQIGEALRHAHESGLVHRDIKPENILVDARNRVRLVDFGLAMLLDPSGRRAGQDQCIAGTLGYMAPEQFSMPEQVDHRADIYATGVVCFEMLTGKLPQGHPVPPPSTTAATDRCFDPIVLKALHRDREERYQHIVQMNTDLTRLTRTPDSTIRFEKTIAAPVDQVYAAWTEPERMASWFAPTDDHTTPIAEVDARVGGRYRIGMKHKDQDYTNIVSGQYCRLDPPDCLSFTWAWEAPRADEHETQVTLEFRPKGSLTELTFIHERFRDEEARKNHAQGWTGCLARLERRLSGSSAPA